MAKFSITLRFDKWDHSPQAHRAEIAAALDQVKQQIGTNVHTEGDITVPAVGAQPRRVIGRWEMEDF